MSFDNTPERRGTHSEKWDSMEALYGVSPDDGISMWVADMEFQPPQCVQDAVQAMLGPTGNMRAPTLRVGKSLLVGFNEEVFIQKFG